jgi:acetyl esterase/lipase
VSVIRYNQALGAHPAYRAPSTTHVSQFVAGLRERGIHATDLGWACLLGEARGSAHVSMYAAAARAADLSGLPPAYVDVGAAETFRDESVLYATRIWQAGGDAELHVWAGGFHGFDQLAPHTNIARDARHARFGWLCRLLNR